MDNDETVRTRVQISRLLALATAARGRGDAAHADLLVERAIKLAQELEEDFLASPKPESKE
jgi:hypothetical protein